MNQATGLALQSLKGLSIGDAFGESFFGETAMVLQHLQQRQVPPTSWEFTDDTIIAIAIYKQLEKHEAIQQNELIQLFIHFHDLDPNRGYGATARRLLREVSEGKSWRQAASEAFDGMGLMGNGAAMRVSPLGAYLYDQPFETIKQAAAQSAEVTHWNEEAACGAMAAKLGRRRKVPIRKDWEKVKDSIMYDAVKAKFSQHPELKELLLSTGTAKLVEHTQNDAYWSDGGDGKGKNKLGKILMKVREELKE